MSADLSTRYLGLQLRNPLVVSASPLTAYATALQQLESAGAAAVILPSLFEEQILRSDHRATSGPAALEMGVQPSMSDYNTGPDGYLRNVELAKKSIEIPVIGSLNGHSRGGWTRFATLIEQAGADALELNIYFVPIDIQTTSQEVEDRYIEVIQAVRAAISIPLAVKVGPYFASLPHFAQRVVQAGANGLVLFNRFLEPEFDIDNFAIRPHLELSEPKELRLSLRWIGILHQQLPLSLAATSGIHDATDVIKALLAGADVAMMASVLLRHGPSRISDMLVGLNRWLEAKKFATLDDVRGLMSRNMYGEPKEFERANYMEALASYSKTF